jgi:hypothetical protein
VKRDGTNFEQRDPERRRNKVRKPQPFVQRAAASGRSGYGSESVRPFLRDQLKLKELMAEPFVPPTEELEPPGE